MALSKTGLRDRIKTKLDTTFGAMSEPGNTYRLQFALAIAEAVVDEIQANGKARVDVNLGGLQQVANADTDPPSPSAKEIPLV